jgi:hypothetical protein
MDHLERFAESISVEGMTVHKLTDEGRSPFLIIDVRPFNWLKKPT